MFAFSCYRCYCGVGSCLTSCVSCLTLCRSGASHSLNCAKKSAQDLEQNFFTQFIIWLCKIECDSLKDAPRIDGCGLLYFLMLRFGMMLNRIFLWKNLKNKNLILWMQGVSSVFSFPIVLGVRIILILILKTANYEKGIS